MSHYFHKEEISHLPRLCHRCAGYSSLQTSCQYSYVCVCVCEREREREREREGGREKCRDTDITTERILWLPSGQVLLHQSITTTAAAAAAATSRC